MQTRTQTAKETAAEFRYRARQYRRIAQEEPNEAERTEYLMLADSLELLAAEYDAKAAGQ
jgi:hypothetical protein